MCVCMCVCVCECVCVYHLNIVRGVVDSVSESIPESHQLNICDDDLESLTHPPSEEEIRSTLNTSPRS